MLDRKIAPSFIKSPEVKIKAAEHDFIHNIPISYITGGTQEVLKIEVVFSGGKWFEKKNGVAYFTSKMLREGTKTHSSKEISDNLDHYGAYLELTSGFDYSSIGLYCLNKYLHKILPIFAEIIFEPVFPESQLELIKEIELQHLKIDLKKTKFKAQKILKEVIFGTTTPYGQTLDEDDISLINRVDILSHFNENYGNFEIFASGKFEPNELIELLESHIKGGSKLSVKEVKYSLNSYKAKEVHQDVKESMQSSLRLGFPFVNKNHEDFIPFQILNHLLGGYFGSRLMKNIREDKGFTYGIYSSVAALRFGSYFSIGTDVVKASADEAIMEIKKELKNLMVEEVPAEELEIVKNHMVGSFQADITSPFSLMDKYKALYLHNMDYSYYDKYFEVLEDITPEDLRNLANKYFKEDNLSIIKVG